MALKPVSVTQLNEYIGRVLQTDPLLGNVSVTGEISNLKYHSSGHIYFSIIDEKSKINCFLPSSYRERLRYSLEDGLKIIIHGYINVYKKGGTYTLFVREVEVAGDGELAACFAILKEKLSKEGLFDPAHKKTIPKLPKKVGIVTAETGAAVRDIIKIITGRTKMVDITVFPVLVQGPEAAKDIADMIDLVNEKFSDIDTLIVGRGGGSAEDLWAFNEEIVARAIYRSRIPVISAVGHEIDFTIADFVADLRAETPTAAAELAVPDSAALTEKIGEYLMQMRQQLQGRLDYQDLLLQRMRDDMTDCMRRRLTAYRQQIDTLKLVMDENRPENILAKGYGILEDCSGHVISSVSSIADGERYRLRLSDGSVTFTASETEESR